MSTSQSKKATNPRGSAKSRTTKPRNVESRNGETNKTPKVTPGTNSPSSSPMMNSIEPIPDRHLYTFYASTSEARTFKNLIENLQNNFRDVCFVFTPSGIYLEALSAQNEIYVDLSFKFEQWFCARDEIKVGVNLQQLHKMIKTIKKDRLSIFIANAKPNQLTIKKAPLNGATNPDVSCITIQSLSVIENENKLVYGRFHTIKTANFQKAIKEMTPLSKSIKIQGNESQLTMSFSIDGMSEKSLGLVHESPSLLDPSQTNYEELFLSKTLNQLAKLHSLNPSMRVYAEPGFPLKLEIEIGTMGTMCIYVKSMRTTTQQA